MGKNRKKFIDKRTAASFHIVHRPSADTDTADEGEHDGENVASKYYLQPTARHNRGPAPALPQGFPTDLLLPDSDIGAEPDVATLIAEARTKRQREREAADPRYLPHEYDYSVHLRPISGIGMFVPATSYYSSTGARLERYDVDEAAAMRPDLRGDRVEEDPLDAEVDIERVKLAEKSARKRRKRIGAAKLPSDVTAVLENDDDNGAEIYTLDGAPVDEIDDDFIIQAIGDDSGDDDDVDEKDEKSDHFDEKSLMEEFEEDDDDDKFDDDDDDDDDDEDDDLYDDDGEDHPRTATAGHYSSKAPMMDDDDFDRFLEEEYDDTQIGALDEAHDEELNGTLSLTQFDKTLDEFLDRKDLMRQNKAIGHGRAVITIDHDDAEVAKQHIQAMESRAGDSETNEDAVNRAIDAEHESIIDPNEQWDCESIITTYTSTENHPRLLVDPSKKKSKIQLSKKTGMPIIAHRTVDEDDGEDDESVTGSVDVLNNGEARPRYESAEERKARKAAVKEAQREARQRKKEMKSAYATAISSRHAEIIRHTAMNPVAAKKL